MSGEEGTTQTPAPAAPQAPAAAPDTTTLEARIKTLEKEATDLQTARAGAQKSAAASDQEAKKLAGELGNANELLQTARTELETTTTAADATTVSLEEAQALAVAAQRDSKVLQLAGQVDPALVSLLTGSGVKIEVPGDSDEDISNALKAFASIVTDKFHQPSAADPAPQAPDTPGVPPVMSGAPVVPNQGEDVEQQLAALTKKAAALAQNDLHPDYREQMPGVLDAIAELEAKQELTTS